MKMNSILELQINDIIADYEQYQNIISAEVINTLFTDQSDERYEL